MAFLTVVAGRIVKILLPLRSRIFCMVIVYCLTESVGAERLNHDRLGWRLRYLCERPNDARRSQSREAEQDSDRSMRAQPGPIGRFVYFVVVRKISEA